jgi:hypothetical protein
LPSGLDGEGPIAGPSGFIPGKNIRQRSESGDSQTARDSSLTNPPKRIFPEREFVEENPVLPDNQTDAANCPCNECLWDRILAIVGSPKNEASTVTRNTENIPKTSSGGNFEYQSANDFDYSDPAEVHYPMGIMLEKILLPVRRRMLVSPVSR